jgi:hypothetical protein
MTVVVASSHVSIPWRKPTKDQLAWIATRLRWVFGAFYLTRFLTHHGPDHRTGLGFVYARCGVPSVTSVSGARISKTENVIACL